MIDPAKPVRFKGDPRAVRVVGTMPSGTLLVVSTYSMAADASDWWLSPWLFHPEGARLTVEGRIVNDRNSPVLENKPVISSGFYPLRTHGGGGAEPYGRGMSSLSGVWDDYGTAKFALELVCEDGKPKEAKIHVRS